MPGTITHLIIQQKLPSYLKEFDKTQQYAKLLEKDPRSTYTAFGSMGPDFLFFSKNDYGDAIGDFVGFIFDVYDALEPLIDFYEENIAPVVDAIEDAVNALDQVVLDGLIKQIGDTATLISQTALAAAEVLVVKNIDLFYPFKPRIQQGMDETEWFWVDYLHYRRTGAFCSEMWHQAGNNEDLQRYCIGYASHIGSDIVGHSFVNAVVGGPYRTHWHRHKLVENWIDAYARNHYPDDALTLKQLAIGADDTYVANAISGSYYYRLCRFPDGTCPKELTELFLSSMETVYGDEDLRPNKFTPDEEWIEDTYRIWLYWLQRSTEIGSAQPPTPVPPPGSATWTLIKDFYEGFPSFPGSSGSSGGFSFWDIFKAIGRFLKWVAECIGHVVEWTVTHLVDILKLPFTEALAFLKWLLYQIQLGVWNIYDRLRYALVMGGYMFPEPRDLLRFPEGKMFINTSYVNLGLGVTQPAYFTHYPQKQEHHDLFGPMEHHLYYPYTNDEMPRTEPAPQPFYGKNPEAFITEGYPRNKIADLLLDCTNPYGPTHAFTHKVDQDTWTTPQLGSALQFSARLIVEHMEKLPNFNLDADRGYGWKTWRGAIAEFDDITEAKYVY
jgi:hypothetical protein